MASTNILIRYCLNNKILLLIIKFLYKCFIMIGIQVYNKKINEFKDENKYNDILENYSPKPFPKSYIGENKIVSEEYDLQIIIPAYNAEKYIEECINSVLNQKTDYKILIIVINDGSTDNTETILKKYCNIFNIRIISQKNLGISEARNQGLKEIFAKYIMFLDSDDILLKNSINNLLNFGFKNDLDIVEGGYYSYLNGDLIRGRGHINSINNNQLFGFPCMKIIKNKIFINLKFPIKTQYEDSIFSYLIYPQNFKCGSIKDFVYGYRVNTNSISYTLMKNKRCVETFYITEELLTNGIDFYNIKLTEELFKQYLNQIKLNYRRTISCPEEVKKAIFFGSKKLMKNKFKEFLVNVKGIDKKLVESLLKNDYGKYCFICKFVRDL